MKIKINFFIICFLILPVYSYAEQGSWLTQDLLFESIIYDATKEACTNMSSKDMYGGLEFDNLYAGIFPSHKFNQLTGAISKEAFLKSSVYLLSDQTNENRIWLVYSSEYTRAVKECFPSLKDQKRFNWLVEKREAAGKGLGLVVSILGIGKFLGIASKASKNVGKAINYGSTTSLLGYFGYTTLERIMKKKYVRDECGELPDLSCLQGVLFELPDDHEDQTLINELRNSDLPDSFLDSIFIH